jgi:hypothetical protein
MLSTIVNGGFLLGFSAGSRNIGTLNIFYYLCALFLRFKVVSDLKINLVEFDLVPMGNVNNVDGLVGI